MIFVMASPLEYPMKIVVRIICIAAICALLGIDRAAAQLAATGCTSEPSANATQTLRCRGGLVIVAEEGAKFTLQSQGGSGAANGVDLQDKALLLDAPKQSGKSRLEVTTPQAIAAVRGTRWAVDVRERKTSVLVLRGAVVVQRPTGSGQVVLGPGQGVDVESGPDPLIVKRWPEARVTALLARLGGGRLGNDRQ
jgi:FecR protein